MEKIKSHIKNKQLTIAKHWKLYSLIGTLLFIAFVLFTFMVRADLLRSFDFNMTVRIQDDIPLRFDYFFSIMSVVGRFEYMIGLLVLIILFRKRILGLIPFFLFGFAHVIELIGKTILEQPGPPRMFLRAQFGDFPGIHVFTDASYPSGHSLRAVFLSIIITFLIFKFRSLPKSIKYLFISGLFILLFLVLISRVSLGEHWTTDVIGGALLGASFAFLSLIFL
jgi:undecaprenyl-diphosphatase